MGLVLGGGCDAFSTTLSSTDGGSETDGEASEATGAAFVDASCVDEQACVGRCGERVDLCGRARRCDEEGVRCASAELCGVVAPNRCGCSDAGRAGAFDVIVSRFVHRDSPASVSHCYAQGATPKDGTSKDCASFVSDGPLLLLSSRKLAPDVVAVFRCLVPGAAGLTTYGLALAGGANCSRLGYAAPPTATPCGASPVYVRRHRSHQSQLVSFDRFEGDGTADYGASAVTTLWNAWAP